MSSQSKVFPPSDSPGSRPRRRFLLLSCSKCSTKVTVQAYEDPTMGDGWPRHRCGFDVNPFDKAAPTEAEYNPAKIDGKAV